jgi:hypothetical protein
MSKYSNRSKRCHRERNTSRGNKGTFISCKVGGGRRPVSRRPLSPLARLRSGAGWPGAGFAAKGRRAGGRRAGKWTLETFQHLYQHHLPALEAAYNRASKREQKRILALDDAIQSPEAPQKAYTAFIAWAQTVVPGFGKAGPPPVPPAPEELQIDLKWALWSEDRGFWDDYAPGVWEKMKKAFEGKSPELTLYTGPRKEIRYGTVSIWKGAARVHFYSVFDAPWELAVERVPEGLEEQAGESLTSFFEGHYGFSGGDIESPIAAEAGGVVKARTFDSLMKKIDAYEQKVLEETEWTGKAVDEHLKWFTEWTAEQGKKGSTARARKSGRSARRRR